MNAHTGEIVRLYGEGLTYLQIAERLGVTRNVVAGICHRHAQTKQGPRVGERRASAKLTPAKVRQIRNSLESDSELARRFDVTPMTVWSVRNGLTWTHVA